jgi:hypothetical protein
MEAAQEAAQAAEADYRQLRAQLDQLAETKFRIEAQQAEVGGAGSPHSRGGSRDVLVETFFHRNNRVC